MSENQDGWRICICGPWGEQPFWKTRAGRLCLRVGRGGESYVLAVLYSTCRVGEEAEGVVRMARRLGRVIGWES